MPSSAGKGTCRPKEGYYSFINQHCQLGFPPDWFNQPYSRLWNYNLHYFDYIFELDYQAAKQLVIDWSNHHPCQPSTAWEPYPVSLRTLNLILYFYFLEDQHLKEDNFFCEFLNQLIERQGLLLLAQTEHHIGANHLFENAVALTTLGLTFEGLAADKFFERGINILTHEIQEQFKADGLHYEKSFSYHSRMLWLLLTLYNLDVQKRLPHLEDLICRGIKALSASIHPDADISLFNDAAFGIAPTPQDLFFYAKSLNINFQELEGPFDLADNGFLGFRDQQSLFIMKYGQAGPDHQPGHAHADIFSFELSLMGERLIVDTGVFDYEASEMRKYCRSTAAHNTLEIDSTDQCELWSVFRMARRVKPETIHKSIHQHELSFEGKVSNYHLKGKTCHHRKAGFKDSVLNITDYVNGPHQKGLSFLHLHPDVSIQDEHTNSIVIIKNKFRYKIEFNLPLHKQKGWYCPAFNKRFENIILYWAIPPNQQLNYQISHINS